MTAEEGRTDAMASEGRMDVIAENEGGRGMEPMANEGVGGLAAMASEGRMDAIAENEGGGMEPMADDGAGGLDAMASERRMDAIVENEGGGIEPMADEGAGGLDAMADARGNLCAMADEGGGGGSTTRISRTPAADVSLRKLRQQYAREVKRKVPPVQHSDVSGSEPESEDEFDPEHVVESESSEELTSEDEGFPDDASGSRKQHKKYVCEKCGIGVSKPVLLTQHMRTHSDQRPFACPQSGCCCTYKRQDHLNRHLKTHQGVMFFCSHSGCHQSFSLEANLQRHLKYHEEKIDFPHVKASGEKTLVCTKPGCGKLFRYPSHLQTHVKNVHEKLEYAELVCLYPGCGDKFSNEKVLVKHAESAHPYLLCEVCGETIPRKSFKRHVRTHSLKVPLEVSCPYDDCKNTYTRESNLRQHVRSVHLRLKPFICSHEGCSKSYAHKATRDRHEVSAVHLQLGTDFEYQDQLQVAKPRGGRKPVTFDKIEDLYIKKRRVDDSSS